MWWLLIRKFVSVSSLCLLLILIFIICIPFNSNSQSTGAIVGTVYDSVGNRVPNANVTLLQGGKLLHIPMNPQLSNDGRTENVDEYHIINVPFGQYMITADKEGYQTSQIITISSAAGVYVQDLVIPNYVFHPPPLMMTPTPKPTPISTPTITVAPSPTSNNDQFNNGLISGIAVTLVIIALIGIGIIIGFVLSRKK